MSILVSILTWLDYSFRTLNHHFSYGTYFRALWSSQLTVCTWRISERSLKHLHDDMSKGHRPSKSDSISLACGKQNRTQTRWHESEGILRYLGRRNMEKATVSNAGCSIELWEVTFIIHPVCTVRWGLCRWTPKLNVSNCSWSTDWPPWCAWTDTE